MDSTTPLSKQVHNLHWLVGVGLTIAAFGLYFTTLAPTVLEADAGEFQFVPWLPGIAHPTGYPFYILLGWVWTHILAVGEVAWRMNLLSAILAAIAVGMTYAVARRLLDIVLSHTPVSARILTAAISAATFAVTPTFWSQAIIAEVYALHTLFVVTILWLVVQHKRPWSGILLAFVFGLGLTHHSTTILLLPGLVLYFWVTRKDTEWKIAGFGTLKSLTIYSLVFFAPLVLYLYIPVVASSTPYATLVLSDTQTLTLYDNSLEGFLRHITATVFAGELQPAAVGIERVLLAWQLLQQQVGWAGIILALIGLFILWQQRCVDLILLTGVTLLTFVAFNLIYFIGDVFVLFIPVWVIICLWLGIGCLEIAHRIAKSYVNRKMGVNEEVAFKQMREQLARNMYQVVITILLLFFFALPAVLLVTKMSLVNQNSNTMASERWQAILQEPLPQSAILLSNDRNEIMPMWYYQYVEGRRPDLMGLFPLIIPDPAYANIGRVLDQALLSDRPVYFIKPMAGLGLKANIEPKGSLFQATPYNTPPLNTNVVMLPEALVLLPSGETVPESIKFLGYDLLTNSINPGDKITLTLNWQTTQDLNTDYTSYVHIITEEGRRIAQSDHQPGGDLYPSSYWQTNEVLRDSHTLVIPADAAAGLYKVRVGMYYQPQPGSLRGMGDGVEIGELILKESENSNE